MKPRTKKERLLLELTKKLPPLTEAQMEYPKNHVFKKKGFYWKKGLVWCQCCGHEYHVLKPLLAVSLDVGGEFCPNCHNEIHLEHIYKGKMKANREGIMYTVITTFKGYQVFRSFTVDRFNKRGNATEYSCLEVFQNWVDPKGRETILTKHYTRSPWHLTWDYLSDFEIGHHNKRCNGYYAMSDLFDITDFYFYPRKTLLPIVKRNGWQNCFIQWRGINMVDLVRSLISNSDMETLAKTGQHEIMRYWLNHDLYKSHDRQRDFFSSICIANRNGYIVKDASLWYDLMKSLAFLGLDLRNAHYVCPNNLKAAHDLYMRRMQRVKAQQERERQREENLKHEAEYHKEKGRYLGICFGNEHFTVTVLQSVEEFFEEGKAMHHCVAGYYSKTESLILSAKDNEHKRLATIELSLKNYKVLQCRSVNNAKPKQYNEIVSLIESHANDFRKAKSKKLKPCKQ